MKCLEISAGMPYLCTRNQETKRDLKAARFSEKSVRKKNIPKDLEGMQK